MRKFGLQVHWRNGIARFGLVFLLGLAGVAPLLHHWYRVGTRRSAAVAGLGRKADILYSYEADLAEWEWEESRTRILRHHDPPGPSWLWRILPKEWVFGVYHVRFIRLVGPGRDGGIVAWVAHDSDLKTLAAFPELRCLELATGSHPITDRGLAHLENLTRLERLSLDGGRITDAGLAHLAKLRRLEHLVIFVAPGTVTETGLAQLGGLGNLRILSLGGVELTNGGLGRLCKAHPKLENLYLRKVNVSDAGLRHLQALSQLRRLDLVALPIRGEGLVDLGALPKLVDLRIVDAYTYPRYGSPRPTLMGDRIPPLEGFPALKILEVDYADLGQEGVRRIAQLRGLEQLDLVNTGVSDDALAHLDLESLRTLSLLGNKITDAGLAQLPALGRLERLDLSATQITDKGLKELRRFPRLRRLSLAANRTITDGAVERLIELEDLEDVDLTDTSVTDDGASRLREARPGLYVRHESGVWDMPNVN